jgi:hypothetical protein
MRFVRSEQRSQCGYACLCSEQRGTPCIAEPLEIHTCFLGELVPFGAVRSFVGALDVGGPCCFPGTVSRCASWRRAYICA